MNRMVLILKKKIENNHYQINIIRWYYKLRDLSKGKLTGFPLNIEEINLSMNRNLFLQPPKRALSPL